MDRNVTINTGKVNTPRKIVENFMPVNSRAKGARGELEAALLLRQLGIEARRSVQYSGFTGDADLLTSCAALHFEVKFSERLSPYAYMEQAVRDASKPQRKPSPVVLMRSSHQPWLVMVRASDWVAVSEALIASRL